MIKWQYSWDDVNPFDRTAHSKLLKEKGAEGWELVSATKLEEWMGDKKLRLYWKRKIYLPTKEKK